MNLDINKLEELTKRFNEINKLFLDPDLVKNQEKFKELSKERSEIEEVVTEYKNYKKLSEELEETKALLKDAEMADLAKEEIPQLEKKIKETEKRIKQLLVKKDPNDDKNVFLEIRAGAGGNEAAIFVADLFRMYSRYVENKKLSLEVINSHPSELDGYKEIILYIKGKNVYFNLKYESGVHRVQRIPVTESQGRIHTSTVTVAVLPEVEEKDVYIDPKDLKIDTYRASGAGGQHVNKTSSAIRITHLPTGIVVTSQDQRSQHQNKAKAMQVLRAKLYEKQEREKIEAIASQRREQVGTGERSEKIRTYNYPQNRVTDHRINLTLYKLDRIIDGELDEIIEALIMHFVGTDD